jgi:hypothetical protein
VNSLMYTKGTEWVKAFHIACIHRVSLHCEDVYVFERNWKKWKLLTFLKFLCSMSLVLYLTGIETSKGVITVFNVMEFPSSESWHASGGTETWRLVHVS